MAELQERRERQDALYADEPWAKLAVKAGFRPYDTESSARAAFRFCADELDRLTAENARLRAKLELTPENVEKAARALCRNDYESDPDEPLGRIEGDPRKYVWELYADDATAAIKALSADQ